MPGMGTGLARRGTIGRPGTSMLERAGDGVGPRPFPAGRPAMPPGLARPGGRMGRTGKLGRATFLGGRAGCGAPGIARAGRGGALAGFGRRGGGLGGAGRRVGMEGAGGGAACCAAWTLGAGRGTRRTDGICGLGNDGAGPPRGRFGVLGWRGTTFTAGRARSGLGVTTGTGLLLSLPSTGTLWGGLVSCCLGFAAGCDFAGRGGATLGVGGGVSPGGRGGTMGRTGVGPESTGGRNGPTGGRNDLLPPVTGIDGRTEAPEVRVFRRNLRLRMDLRFGNGSSSSGIGADGSARLRSLILSRTLSAVASSNELE